MLDPDVVRLTEEYWAAARSAITPQNATERSAAVVAYVSLATDIYLSGFAMPFDADLLERLRTDTFTFIRERTRELLRNN